MKKLVSILIAIIMMATMTSDMFAAYFSNDIYDTQYFEHIDNNMQISGTNSFGNMLSEAISDELAEQQENAGYNVISVEISGQVATVELSTLCDSTVVVGIYDEAGEQLLMTASAPATQNDEYVTVLFDQPLPQYFYIKAYLIDSTTLRPLCTVYDCPNYTQEMQEFFAKTVYDFNPEKVLNLDGDVTNNFAVYSDNVAVIPQVEGVNTFISQGGGMYTFANADENILSLQSGQIFSYEYAPGEVIIAKVAAVAENPDGTVTVTEQDAELEDAFEYIKIDTEAGMDTAKIDNSELEEGVEFVGMTGENPEPYGIMPMFNIEGSVGTSAEYKFVNRKLGGEHANVTINGSIKLNISVKLELYLTDALKYVEISFESSVDLKASITGKVSGDIKLGHFGFSPVAGVYIDISPVFNFEASAKIEFELGFVGSEGVRLSNQGNQNISKSPKFTSALDVEGTISITFKLQPQIGVVHEKLANIEFGAELKATASAKLVGYDTEAEKPDDRVHLCSTCLDGDIKVTASISAKVTLLDSEKWEFKFVDLNIKWKARDFYYSFDYSDFAFTKCPHYKYKTTLLILDRFMRRVPGAKIEVSGDKFEKTTFTADENGVVEVDMLEPGTYTVSCQTEGFKDSNIEFEVKDSPLLQRIQLEFSDDRVLDGSRVVQVSVGYWHSAAITENGDLYTWGSNTRGQLGNGLSHGYIPPYLWQPRFEEGIDSAVPIKVMSNVKSVSLGDALTAAITDNGDLYMWGDNWWGGNGITHGSLKPIKVASNVIDVYCHHDEVGYVTADGALYMSGIYDDDMTESFKKIMDNVISVKFGSGLYAAITNTGDMYMWGINTHGSFGLAEYIEYEYVEVPVKVMSNVVLADVAYEHAAAITTDGSLYVWGSNEYGQVGNQSTEDVLMPLKLMDNVAEVNISEFSSSAVTTDGTLYTWGENTYCQLGIGEEGDSHVPVAILENVATADIGSYHAGAVTHDGKLYMWGNGVYGQLGDGAIQNSPAPIKVTIPADTPAPASISTLSALPMAAAETSPTSGTFTGLLPNEIYNIYALRSRTAAVPLAASNLLYIAQATSDAAGNLPYNCTLLGDCPNPVIFCKAMHEFALGNAQISGADISRDSITVKWDAYPGADLYRVYRVVNGIYILEGETDMTEYTVSGLVAGREYGFAVECRVNGEWSYRAAEDVVYLQTEAEPEYMLGDVNADGNVTLDDAVLTLRKAMSVDVLSDVFVDQAADVTGDGGISLDDAVAILKIAMKVTDP